MSGKFIHPGYLFWFSEHPWGEGGEVRHKHPESGSLPVGSQLLSAPTAFISSVFTPRKPEWEATWKPSSILRTPCHVFEVKCTLGSALPMRRGWKWAFLEVAQVPWLWAQHYQPEQRALLCPSWVPSHLPHFLSVYLLYLGADLFFWLGDCEGTLYDLHETICGSYSVSSTVLESPHLRWANTLLGLLKRLTSRDRIKPEGWGECHFDEVVVPALPGALSDTACKWCLCPMNCCTTPTAYRGMLGEVTLSLKKLASVLCQTPIFKE